MRTVISKDGTRIAYDKMGSGDTVILVDGAFCSRGFGPMSKIATLLSDKFTVYTYDRRGRGDSGDTKPYSVQREIEDLDALIDAAGGETYLFGISSGAMLCLNAVAAGLHVKRLAVFEPPYVKEFRTKPIGNFMEPLQNFIAQGEHGRAVQFYLRSVMGVPAILPLLLRLTPHWSKMKANAASLVYDGAIAGNFSIPEKIISAITIHVLVVSSGKSPTSLQKPAEKLGRELRFGKHTSLKGGIHDVPAKVIVPVLESFFQSAD